MFIVTHIRNKFNSKSKFCHKKISVVKPRFFVVKNYLLSFSDKLFKVDNIADFVEDESLR